MPPKTIYALFAVIATGAAAAAVVRWRKTPPWDDEHDARRDMALLVVTAAVGLGLVAVRARYLLATRSFYLCTWLLIPPALAAIVLTVRLLARYRQEH